VAVALTAISATGRSEPTFRRPLTLRLWYNPAGLSRAQQDTLVIAVVDPAGRRWSSLRTTVDTGAHTLTATTSRPGIIQARLLSGAVLRLAWPVIGHGQPAQSTIAGDRAAACPSVEALRNVIAANTQRGLRNPFDPPYPAGCLWLPFQLSDAALAPQFARARVVVTSAYPDRSRAVLTATLDSQGRATAVLRVRFRPRSHDHVGSHAGPAGLATLKIVVADRHGVAQPPISAHFVVVASRR
jgi:hypothetical protein